MIEGVFTDDEKQRMIENGSKAMASVEDETLREETVVILDEVTSGDWAVGGTTPTADEVKRLRASS